MYRFFRIMGGSACLLLLLAGCSGGGSSAASPGTTASPGAPSSPSSPGVPSSPETPSSQAPEIDAVTPASGLPGTTVTITGTNLSATSTDNVIKFNGTAAVVSSSTATRIVTTVPSGATTGPVTVTVGDKTATSSINFAVTVLLGGAVQGNPLSLADTVTTIGGKAGTAGSDDGVGTAATFHDSCGITTDGTNLYVADVGNHTIRKMVIATGEVTTMAGKAGTTGSNDGVGTAATFHNPHGITTDGTNLYVADSTNNTIRKIVIATAEVTTIAGKAGTSGLDDGVGTTATFYWPHAVTTDGTNLYVADSTNHTIRKIVIATGEVTTIAGKAGTAGSDDGTGTAATFNNPHGITTDGTNLYVADYINNTIRKIVIASGEVTTMAGKAGTSGTADGAGTAATFHNPLHITTDGTNLYVTDNNNHTIRKMVIATGEVTTIAGKAGTAGSDDGTGTAATFNNPHGITNDGTNLYVTDSNNNTIRKIQ